MVMIINVDSRYELDEFDQNIKEKILLKDNNKIYRYYVGYYHSYQKEVLFSH